jgi:hypothetical protein
MSAGDGLSRSTLIVSFWSVPLKVSELMSNLFPLQDHRQRLLELVGGHHLALPLQGGGAEAVVAEAELQRMSAGPERLGSFPFRSLLVEEVPEEHRPSRQQIEALGGCARSMLDRLLARQQQERAEHQTTIAQHQTVIAQEQTRLSKTLLNQTLLGEQEARARSVLTTPCMVEGGA